MLRLNFSTSPALSPKMTAKPLTASSAWAASLATSSRNRPVLKPANPAAAPLMMPPSLSMSPANVRTSSRT
jgi:hypothetical protein